MERTIFIAFFLLITFSLPANNDGWTDLFNGKNLDGWEKLNGEAHYEVKDGAIVGTSKLNTPNTFLCAKKMYSDFILEFEVWVDPSLNSGVQFRSLSKPDYKNGRIHGYQVEIDPAPRAFSGGIYDEARRGWLYPLSLNPKGRKAFVNGMWNKYRVEAVGTSLRTWVNGINTANLIDDKTASGLIGLQVHSIETKEQEGTQVKWRNIRIKTTELEKERWPMGVYAPEENLIPNTLSDYEKRKGWRMLWDGKTTKGWRSARADKFPEGGWSIQNGELIVEESEGGESTNGGDIITVDKYSSFELKVEFKLTEGANSGIKYFVDPNINKGKGGSSIGLEYQILDDKGHPDAEKGVNGNRKVASLYDLIPATNLSVPNNDKPINAIGEWNRAHLIVRGNHIEHWLNGYKVVEYERNNPMFRALVAYSKYKVWPNFGELPEGHILLQDHGNQVFFRSIKIREL